MIPNGDDGIVLNDSNFLIYATKFYDNTECMSWEEFVDDLKRIKYIKRLFNRFRLTGDLKERLILNHIIILSNVFGVKAATKILFYKLDDSLHPLLKTFLVYLNYMPDTVVGARKNIIYNSDLPIVVGVANVLRRV